MLHCIQLDVVCDVKYSLQYDLQFWKELEVTGWLISWIRWLWNHRDVLHCQKLLHCKSCVRWHIVVVEQPSLLPLLHLTPSHNYQNLYVERCINLMAPWGKNSWSTMPSLSKKTIMIMTWVLNWCAFFGLGEPCVCHWEVWAWFQDCTCVSSPIFTWIRNFGLHMLIQ